MFMRLREILGIAAWTFVAWLGVAPVRADEPSSDPVWKETVAAAEKEGSVAINMPAGNALREFLVGEWPKSFPKVSLVTNSLDEGTWIARVRLERQSGKYL